MSVARPALRSGGGAVIVLPVLVHLGGLAPAALGAEAPQAGGGPFAKVLGRDDEEFARNLSRSGYPDLAQIVLDAIESSSGGKESVRSAMLRLELEQDQAHREPDTLKRIGLLEGLIQSRQTFVELHKNAPESAEILSGQQELYRSVGELITTAIR